LTLEIVNDKELFGYSTI